MENKTQTIRKSFSNISLRKVKVWYLTMPTRPASYEEGLLALTYRRSTGYLKADAYRRIYFAVGENWHWLDRMVMPDSDLEQAINATNTEIWILYFEGKEAGYAEFVREKDYTEIQYFGLFPDFVGKGLGKFFLNWVVQKAWSYQPAWIQLNTCELDHPNALSVYQAAGFKIVREEIQERKILN